MEPAKSSLVGHDDQQIATPARLDNVLAGFTPTMHTAQTLQKFERYAHAIDSIGCYDTVTSQPYIDAHALREFLEDYLDPKLTEQLIMLLASFPTCHFLPNKQAHLSVIPVRFFELASNIVIFDASPDATFRELDISSESPTREIVTAVQFRFPSLEREFLESEKIPKRLEALIMEDDAIELTSRAVFRQLGWWAVLVTVLLIPAMSISRLQLKEEELSFQNNVWPVAMFLLASAVGGGP